MTTSGGRLINLTGLAGRSAEERRLLSGTVCEAAGVGVFMTIGIIYLTAVRELEPVHVAAVMTVCGITGLILGAPIGALVDRVGVRVPLRTGLIIQALGAAALISVGSLPTYAVLVFVVTLAQRTAYAARSVLIAQVFADDRVGGKAKVRALQNVGLGVGGLCGTAALAADSEGAYIVGFLLNAALFLISAALMGSASVDRTDQAPPQVQAPDPVGPFMAVHKDLRFVRFAVLNGLVSVHFGVFEVGLPLWVVGHTEAPRWVVGVSYVMATVLVVLFQVRVSARADTVQNAARTLHAAVTLILVSTGAYAAAAHVGPAWATLLVLAGTGVYVLGEMGQVAASWALSFEMSPEARMGEYQAAFGSFVSAGMMLAPLIVTTVTLHGDGIGFVVTGVAIAILGVVTTAVVHRAPTRPAEPQEMLSGDR